MAVDDENENPKAPETVRVKLNFRIPQRMPTLYAHHLFVQPGQNEVVLSFFEVILPLFGLDGTSAPDQLKLMQESGIAAECIARITIAKDLFPNFAKAMQDILDQTVGAETAKTEEEKDANNSRDNPKG